MAHDTNPDIGLTLSRNGETHFFSKPAGLRFFVDAVQLDSDRVLLADFGGKLVLFDTATKKFVAGMQLPFEDITNVYYQGNTIYAISQQAGKVALIDAATFAVRDVWSVVDVVGLTPGDGGVWIITNTTVSWKPTA